MERYVQYAVEQTCALLAIDSPTGFTERAAERVRAELTTLGFAPEITRKGGVLVCLNPEQPEANALLLEAHTDTLGGMVTQITDGGRLKLTALGGMDPNTPRERTCASTPGRERYIPAPSSCTTRPSM